MINNTDISDELEFKNGKGNPFGWSQEEIWHKEKRIGFLESGSVHLYDKNYFHKLIKEKDKTRAIIYLRT